MRVSRSGSGRVAERSDSTWSHTCSISNALVVRPFQLIQLEEVTALNFTSRGAAAGTREGRGGSDASFTSSIMVKDSRKEQRSREGKEVDSQGRCRL